MKHVFCVVTAIVVACAHPAAAGEARRKGAGDDLVGMWKLVGVVAVRPNGETTISEWGKSPTGYIAYHPTGHMAVQLVADPRPAFQDPAHPRCEELARTHKSFLAYAGTYDYDAAKRLVIHHVEISTDPTEVGKDLPRKVELQGDRMTLVAQQVMLSGEEVFTRLTWERLR